jgi:hypothetical protein
MAFKFSDRLRKWFHENNMKVVGGLLARAQPYLENESEEVHDALVPLLARELDWFKQKATARGCPVWHEIFPGKPGGDWRISRLIREAKGEPSILDLGTRPRVPSSTALQGQPTLEAAKWNPTNIVDLLAGPPRPFWLPSGQTNYIVDPETYRTHTIQGADTSLILKKYSDCSEAALLMFPFEDICRALAAHTGRTVQQMREKLLVDIRRMGDLHRGENETFFKHCREVILEREFPTAAMASNSND